MVFHCISSFQAMVCCCTKSYFDAVACVRELHYTIEKGLKCIPLLFENMVLEGDARFNFAGIRELSFYDTDDGALEPHLQNLIETLQKKLVNANITYYRISEKLGSSNM